MTDKVPQHTHEFVIVQNDSVAAFCQRCPQDKRMAPTWTETGIATLSFREVTRRINRVEVLEAALAEVVDVFDNGINVDAWDAYEKRIREAMPDA